MSIEALYAAAFAEDRVEAEAAAALLPDGVTTAVRVMAPFPLHVVRADGARKWTTGGRELIDYGAGHGALLFGHNPLDIVAAVQSQMAGGTHFSACSAHVTRWAEVIQALCPNAEKLRFTASGAEANMLALTLAAAFTGKHRHLRFEEHYHGWTPTLLGRTDEAAIVPAGANIDAVTAILEREPEIGAILLEPTGANSGVVPIRAPFLQDLRALTAAKDVLLILDEVVTGFRIGPGGAQQAAGVCADLTVYGKIVAGGLPGGVLAGRADVLDLLSTDPVARQNRPHVLHMGTFSGNAVSAVAGTAALERIRVAPPYTAIDALAAALRAGMNTIIDTYGLDWAVYGDASCVKLLFGHGRDNLQARDFHPDDWPPARLLTRGDAATMWDMRLLLLVHGVDLAPSSFLTAAHSQQDIDATLGAFEHALHDFLRLRSDTA